MEQYISKSALLTEIEKLRDELQEKVETSDFITGEVFIMNYFISFLDFIEVKEVDLNKEFEWFLDKVEGVPRMWHSDEQIEWAKAIAKHFLELGCKTQKEEPVSEDLEKAAKHYLYSNILYDDVYVGNPTEKDCIKMFEAGAKWQKEKDLKLKLPTEISATVERIAHDSGHTFEQSFAILSAAKRVYEQGKSDMKQQMMKNAIPYRINDMPGQPPIVLDHYRLYEQGIRGGDKVKLIIIKED